MKHHKLRKVLQILLSLGAGALSVADKRYELFYLAAPVLTASATSLRLSPHGIILGQLTCLIMSGGGKRLLPVLAFIYLLTISFAGSRKKSKALSPGALGGILIFYEIILYFAVGSDLLIGIAGGILSGCAAYFISFLKDDCDFFAPDNRQWTAILLLALFTVMLCDAPFLEGVILQSATLFIMFLFGSWQLWQSIISCTALACVSAAANGELSVLPMYLAAATAIGVVHSFGRKKYTAAALLCSEIALLPTGIFLEHPFWLMSAPIAALAFLSLPLADRKRNITLQREEELGTQYRDLVDQVDKLHEAAGERISFYPEIAARGSDLLQQAGAQDINVTCAKDLLGGFFLDVSFKTGSSHLTKPALLGLMERAGGFALTARRYHDAGDEVYACFVRRAPYTVQCAAMCKTKEGETVCGDSALAFSADQSHYVLLLSDGMGSGKSAFAQSCWTVTLLQKLLRAGLKAEGALGLVHSSLKLAQEEIAFATVDLCSINLWDGTARFVKAGAVSTFILRKEQIIEVCGVSMPLGAAENPDLAAEDQRLEQDDLILLISDGAYERKDEILYTLQKYRRSSVRELTEKLMASALDQGQAGEDDVTVLVARFIKNQ